MHDNHNNKITTLEEPGSFVITETGIVPGFDKLSEKKQKVIIVSEIATTANEICKSTDDIQSAQLRIKEINSFLRRTKEFKELVNLKSAIKDSKKKNQLLSQERAGMLRLAKKLGFDIEAEIKNIKRLNV